MITEQRDSRPATVLSVVVGCALLFLTGAASAQEACAGTPSADANIVTTPAPPVAGPSFADRLRLCLQSAHPVVEPKSKAQLTADNGIAPDGSINFMINRLSKYVAGNNGDINVATGRSMDGAATNTAAGAGAGQAPAPKDYKIEVFGAVKVDVIYSATRPQAPGVPFFLVPKLAGGFSNSTLDIHARQSMIGVLFTGHKIGDFQSGGRVSAVFFDSSVLADTNGFLLQASYGELFNEHWRFAAGLQFDVFAPGLPTVLPFSYLGGSGSSGNCIRGQLRAEHFADIGGDTELTLQGALSQPLNTAVTPDIVLDEDNGWPNIEGRIGFGIGKPAPLGKLVQRPVEIGISGLIGELRRTAPPTDPPRRVVSEVWGASLDFRVNFPRSFGIKGEVYTGQALGNYNGGILQSLDAVTWKAIRAAGGWVEGFAYVTPSVHIHTGYGFDDPNENDITPIPGSLFGRTYNSTFYTNVLWDLDKTFRIGIEFTYRHTEYKEPTNLSSEGFGFHTQFAWYF